MPDLTPAQAEAFEERAAIMEYDGGLGRERAEELARAECDRPDAFDPPPPAP